MILFTFNFESILFLLDSSVCFSNSLRHLFAVTNIGGSKRICRYLSFSLPIKKKHDILSTTLIAIDYNSKHSGKLTNTYFPIVFYQIPVSAFTIFLYPSSISHVKSILVLWYKNFPIYFQYITNDFLSYFFHNIKEGKHCGFIMSFSRLNFYDCLLSPSI